MRSAGRKLLGRRKKHPDLRICSRSFYQALVSFILCFAKYRKIILNTPLFLLTYTHLLFLVLVLLFANYFHSVIEKQFILILKK